MTTLSPKTQALVSQVEAALPSQQTPEFERLDEQILTVRVCTSLTDDEATERVNRVPAGVAGGWRLSTDPDLAPLPCEDKPATHRHLIFEC